MTRSLLFSLFLFFFFPIEMHNARQRELLTQCATCSHMFPYVPIFSLCRISTGILHWPNAQKCAKVRAVREHEARDKAQCLPILQQAALEVPDVF